MHCYDSTILCDGGPAVLEALFDRLVALGKGQAARRFVIMNVAEEPLLASARGLGLEVSYMFDRFPLDLDGLDDLDSLNHARAAQGRPQRDAPPAAQVRDQRRARHD